MARELPETFLVAFSFAGEQRDFVRAVAEAVEAALGSSAVFFDEWFEHYIAGADADLKLQQIYGENCALAVVCVSERYGDKPWTQAEHEAIRARQIKARSTSNERDRLAILPIRVGDGEVDGIPFNTIVPDVRSKSADQTAELIINRLRLIVPATGSAPPGPSWPEAPLQMRWPVANHRVAREAFANLLTRATPWRCLPILGPSELGKSHITKQMLVNALHVDGLACGRFDFKGTTDLDDAVRGFVQELQVPLPPESGRLNARLGFILDKLKQRAKPALLVFDTYEAAGTEGQDWVEKQLLPSLIRATWLRVVIAGQRVPSHSAAVWGEYAAPTVVLEPPPALDWFHYSELHQRDLTLAQVELVCSLASHKASLLAQLLGPKT